MTLYRRDLGKRCAHRQDDRGRRAQESGGKGDPLAVVARRSGHHASRAFLWIDRQQARNGAADLECARTLHVFQLEIHLAADYAAQVRRVLGWRVAHVRRLAFPRRAHLLERQTHQLRAR